MRFAPAKRKASFSMLGGVFALCLSLMSASPAVAVTKPYFKTFGADVFTGGWFDKSASACSTAPAGSSPEALFQDPKYKTPDSPLTGGILTYAKQAGGNSSGGASSQYGVFGLGRIEGNDASKFGFYSSGALADGSIARDLLTFANSADSATIWGGDLQGVLSGGGRSVHCIPDFYNIKKASANPAPGPTASLNAAAGANGNYTLSTTCGDTPICLTSGSDVVIPEGRKVVVFVQGNLFIGNNVRYAASYDADKVPKLTVIVQGSIYIDRNVSQLDGLYIAQPLPKCNPPTVTTGCAANPVLEDTGVLWTCHPNNTAGVLSTFPNTCTTKLTINGAVIAKQVNFFRTGTTRDINNPGATASEPSTSDNISEVINYIPAMVIDGSMFSDPPPTPTLSIEKLVSLPPIF